jgi:hypothetical protein
MKVGNNRYTATLVFLGNLVVEKLLISTGHFEKIFFSKTFLSLQLKLFESKKNATLYLNLPLHHRYISLHLAMVVAVRRAHSAAHFGKKFFSKMPCTYREFNDERSVCQNQ